MQSDQLKCKILKISKVFKEIKKINRYESSFSKHTRTNSKGILFNQDQFNCKIIALNLSWKMQYSDLKFCILKSDHGFLSDGSDKQI